MQKYTNFNIVMFEQMALEIDQASSPFHKNSYDKKLL
jgi:hypothetical protein